MVKFTLALGLAGAAFLSGCGAPSTPATAAAGQPQVWQLTSLDNKPYHGNVTVSLAKNGKQLMGQAPCNAFNADIIRDAYPAVRIVNVVSTKMACPDMAAEADFFDALSVVTGQGTGKTMLYFTSTSGRRLEFTPIPG